MKFKEAWKKHKKKVLIIGGIAVTGVLVYIGGKNDCFKKSRIKVEEGVLNLLKEEDIPISEAGKALGITEYFQEQPFLRCMFIDTFAWHLGELGEALIEQFDANPDCPIAITLEYVSNE